MKFGRLSSISWTYFCLNWWYFSFYEPPILLFFLFRVAQSPASYGLPACSTAIPMLPKPSGLTLIVSYRQDIRCVPSHAMKMRPFATIYAVYSATWPSLPHNMCIRRIFLSVLQNKTKISQILFGKFFTNLCTPLRNVKYILQTQLHAPSLLSLFCLSVPFSLTSLKRKFFKMWTEKNTNCKKQKNVTILRDHRWGLL